MQALIHDLQRLREQRHVFEDRFQAGRVLADMLQAKYARKKSAIILAIPAGGVPVGMELRDALSLAFDLMIVRKLKIPDNPEAGFGAMTLEGKCFLNEALVSRLNLTSSRIEEEKKRVLSELENRNEIFREAHPAPEVTGKNVILADDGLASGFTMLASIKTVKSLGAERIIVAVPTAPRDSLRRLEYDVDEIFCPNIRSAPYFAVAEAYRCWRDLDEEEIRDFLGL